MHALLNNNQPQDFGNLHAPGFNKITDDNKFGAGINYTIAYAFPFRFKKEKAKAEWVFYEKGASQITCLY